jgi:ABC-type sugar transport system substrate-binding protein
LRHRERHKKNTLSIKTNIPCPLAAGLLIFIALVPVAFSSCNAYKFRALVLTTSKFDASYAEIQEAADAWGKAAGIKVVVDAPNLPKATWQQQLLEERLSEAWDIICVEPLGVAELSPLLENAKDKGSIIVSLNGRRLSIADYDIEPFSRGRLGEAMMDALAAVLHSDGLYITLLPSFAAEDILDTETAAVRLQRQKHASMTVVDRLSETGADAVKTRRIVNDSILRYSINGLLFFTSADGQGAAGHTYAEGNRVAAIGLGEPKILGKAVEEGLVDALFYWEKSKLVLAGLEMGRMAASGRKFGGEAVSLPVEGYETLRRTDGNVWEAYAVKVLKGSEQ